ncbi:MAG: phosphotransferase enzyme family protein [Acidimicrobiales bacterium]
MADGDDVLDQRSASWIADDLVSRGIVDGPLHLLRSGSNYVFRAGDMVVRVSNASSDQADQLALIRRLSEAGVPVLEPQADLGLVGGARVTLWEYIEPGTRVDYAGLGHAIARLHTIPPEDLADLVPLPWYGEAPWLQFEANLDAAAGTDILDAAEVDALRQVCEELRNWHILDSDEPVVVCHGDVHPANVLMRDGRPVIIDWDLICLGPPAWDHAALLTWPGRWGGGPSDYSDFARGYGKDLSADALARRLARVRLIGPTINMVRLATSTDRARAEAKVRLRYWMGDPEAPQWTPL